MVGGRYVRDVYVTLTLTNPTFVRVRVRYSSTSVVRGIDNILLIVRRSNYSHKIQLHKAYLHDTDYMAHTVTRTKGRFCTD